MSLAYDMALQNVDGFLKRTTNHAKVHVDYVRGAVPGSAQPEDNCTTLLPPLASLKQLHRCRKIIQMQCPESEIFVKSLFKTDKSNIAGIAREFR